MLLLTSFATRGCGQNVHLLMKWSMSVKYMIHFPPTHTPQTYHQIWNSFIKIMLHHVLLFYNASPEYVCVIVQIDSLHICCQGHHQGLMNERWKETSGAAEGRRALSTTTITIPASP